MEAKNRAFIMRVKTIAKYFYCKDCEVILENELSDYGFLDAVDYVKYKLCGVIGKNSWYHTIYKSYKYGIVYR